METVFFLIFVGVCAFVVVLLTRGSGKAKQLRKTPAEKLTPVSHDRLSHKEEVWEARRQFTQKNLSSAQRFVPKSLASEEPEYDGYSRRDRHHLTTAGQIKKESRVDEVDEYTSPVRKFDSEKPAVQ